MSKRGDMVVVIAATIPVLLLRLLGSALGMAFRSRRSVTRFRRTLRSTGVEPELARRLTTHYRDQTNIIKIIRMAIRSSR